MLAVTRVVPKITTTTLKSFVHAPSMGSASLQALELMCNAGGGRYLDALKKLKAKQIRKLMGEC